VQTNGEKTCQNFQRLPRFANSSTISHPFEKPFRFLLSNQKPINLPHCLFFIFFSVNAPFFLVINPVSASTPSPNPQTNRFGIGLYIIMPATAFHQGVGTLQSHGRISNSAPNYECGNLSMRLIPKGFKVEIGISRREPSRKRTSILMQSSSSQKTAYNPVSSPLHNASKESPKKSNEAALILIRHGESLWNEKNLFTGCVDVPLTKRGVEEAANARSQIFSEETKKQCIPVVTAWQLNERMYGELQGLNKQETADKYGKEQVHEWRRSFDIPPPNGESLEMCAERAVAYFKEQIEPQLRAGKNVMIAAHGNSLRSIIMYLDKLTSQEVISLELSTGIPMLYIVKEEKYIRRGSPAAPSEAGVYAYTKDLARYRQKLDEMVH
ncbi:Histidine phosphatase superfamily, clade-1, partial [Cynara cardunculus var. scolymus]